MRRHIILAQRRPRDPRPQVTLRVPGNALIAASPHVLWRLLPPSRPGAVPRPLRSNGDPLTGDLGATIRLPGTYSRRPPLATTRSAAWVVTVRGQLIRIGVDGRVARTAGPVRSLIGDGRRELWALGPDNRTMVRIDPTSGRLRERIRLDPRLATSPVPLAMTRRHVWVANAPGIGTRITKATPG